MSRLHNVTAHNPSADGAKKHEQDPNFGAADSDVVSNEGGFI